MKKICFLVLIISLSTLSLEGQARVFDFKKETFGAFFSATGHNLYLNQSAFKNSIGDELNYSQTSNYGFGFRLGFLFNMTSVSLRLGIEGFQAKQIINADVKNTSDVVLYNLDSSVITTMPFIGLDLALYQSQNSRMIIGLNVGQATVKMENSIAFTDIGTSTYGLSNFSESSEDTILGGDIFLGYETLATDTVTANFELGYRQMISGKQIYKSSATTFLGDVNSGDSVLNADGNGRTLNLSGPFIGLTFKFYIDTI